MSNSDKYIDFFSAKYRREVIGTFLEYMKRQRDFEDSFDHKIYYKLDAPVIDKMVEVLGWWLEEKDEKNE